MPGPQLTTSSPSSLAYTRTYQGHGAQRPSGSMLVLDGLVVRRFAGLLLLAGALLAWAPIHPGLLCPLRATTGVPCPTCGMTTSVKACLNLDFGAAVASSPAGIAAVFVAAGLVVLRPRRVVVPWAAIGVALAFMWIWQLFRFSVI